MAGLRESTLGRRTVSIGAVFVATAVLMPATIVLLPLLFVVDLVTAPRRLPRCRGYLFLLYYLAWECIAAVATGLLWVLSGFGLFLDRRWMQHLHVRLQQVWAAAQLAAMARLLHLRFDHTEVGDLPDGPLVCLARHASMIDTLIPMELFTAAGRRCRYVLKSELTWDPALDIVGHRLPNHFADRSGAQTERELAAIRQLATGLDDDEVLVIFPEGTRFTTEKRDRVLQKLADGGSPQLAAATALTQTMPPRVGGVGAVFDGAPDARVLILAHTGLEGLASFGSILAAIPMRWPVRVATWTAPRPADDGERTDWLFDQWAVVDRWVEERVDAR